MFWIFWLLWRKRDFLLVPFKTTPFRYTNCGLDAQADNRWPLVDRLESSEGSLFRLVIQVAQGRSRGKERAHLGFRRRNIWCWAKWQRAYDRSCFSFLATTHLLVLTKDENNMDNQLALENVLVHLESIQTSRSWNSRTKSVWNWDINRQNSFAMGQWEDLFRQRAMEEEICLWLQDLCEAQNFQNPAWVTPDDDYERRGEKWVVQKETQWIKWLWRELKV